MKKVIFLTMLLIATTANCADTSESVNTENSTDNKELLSPEQADSAFYEAMGRKEIKDRLGEANWFDSIRTREGMQTNVAYKNYVYRSKEVIPANKQIPIPGLRDYEKARYIESVDEPIYIYLFYSEINMPAWRKIKYLNAETGEIVIGGPAMSFWHSHYRYCKRTDDCDTFAEDFIAIDSSRLDSAVIKKQGGE